MKKVLLIFCACLVTLTTYAQDVAGIFYDGNPIPHSRITGERLGNLAGAYFSMGLSGAKRNLQIEGESSELVITEKRPSFIVKFNPEFTKYRSIFSTSENMDYLVMVMVKKGKNKRQLQTGSYGLTGVESSLSDKSIIPLSIEENEDGIYTITPKKDLKPGQYAFWFTKKIVLDEVPEDGKEQAKAKPYNMVFDFEIKK